MAIDFSVEPEFQEQLDWVRQFCEEEIAPFDLMFPAAIRLKHPAVMPHVKRMQDQIKERGLWALFLGKELGGPGFGQVKLALLNEILGRYPAAPGFFGTAAPDTGNMELLAEFGTPEQKERWLYPLMRQEIFSAYSMTEPQGGSDPNLFVTSAVKEGDEYVINGEKWFTSAGRYADILLVMTVNGMFVVPRNTPGVTIMPEPRNHNHIVYKDVRVPLDHLLGPEDGAKVLAQKRLAGGRIHHARRGLAQCHLAFDMMCERALSRNSHGNVVAQHQMVQERIADSYAKIQQLRLLILWSAWTIDNVGTQAARTQIAATKYTVAKTLREVAYDAMHMFGALGTTDLTPLQAMWANAPTMSVMDGVDEVHKVTVAKNVLKGYKAHEGLWPTHFTPFQREAAQKKFEPLLAEDPELRQYSEGMQAYMAGRH